MGAVHSGAVRAGNSNLHEAQIYITARIFLYKQKKSSGERGINGKFSSGKFSKSRTEGGPLAIPPARSVFFFTFLSLGTP